MTDRFVGKLGPVCLMVLFALALAGCSSSSPPFSSSPPPPGDPVGANLTHISADPYTIGPGQHATEVEPHMLANGSTLVAAFQTGRIAPGGATDIGWATSTDGGTTWSHGFLPGLTTGEGTGPYDAVSDPVQLEAQQHQNRAKNYALTANITMGVGGAAVLAGLIWEIVVLRDHRSSDHRASLVPHPGGLGVAWVWR